MSTTQERKDALDSTYAKAVETGREEACPLAVSYNDYTKYKERRPDATIRFGKFPGGNSPSGASSGSRMGQVRIWVPRA